MILLILCLVQISLKMVLVQVSTPTLALLIDYSETIMALSLVEMIYFGGQHRPERIHKIEHLQI